MGRDKCVIKREKETDFGFGAQVGMSAVSHLKFVSRDWHGRIAGNSDRALSALRPSYLPDEVLLFVQDNVGLYEGKFKLPNQQNGQVYLTTHRICYVDKSEPRLNSAALELKDVDRYEFYAGFLKSSAKITLIPKPMRKTGFQSHRNSTAGPSPRHGTPTPQADSGYRPPSESQNITAATWVCKICSFSNPVPANFDATTANIHTPLPPCLACGIKPTLQHVLKAAIANAAKRSPAAPPVQPPAAEPASDMSNSATASLGQSSAQKSREPLQCPRSIYPYTVKSRDRLRSHGLSRSNAR
ncbi:hypothetical protein NQ176_g8878 [Zarea fungicola]|uniref:Uncharacterized protein n=1 Tax=Zarea fungicola TaxID=93591 RepID=A0ACC1MQT4_9HYPO|nr:hypothetical protein NQ176_g8878 [Lecanicillium fungicola]